VQPDRTSFRYGDLTPAPAFANLYQVTLEIVEIESLVSSQSIMKLRCNCGLFGSVLRLCWF
jgi:hypothetical protein